MRARIGTSADSWGVRSGEPPHPLPWRRFLDEVAEAGFEWLELSSHAYLPTSADLLGSELNARGLRASGVSVAGHLEDATAWPALCTRALRAAEIAATLEAPYMVVFDSPYTDPAAAPPFRHPVLGRSAWQRLVETLDLLDRLAREEVGLHAVFHPHADSHVEHESQVESLLHESQIDLCLDLGHHAYEGHDPVAFFRRHSPRIPYMHVKNVDPAVRSRVMTAGLPFADAVDLGVFCEPDRGEVEFAAVAAALEEACFDGWAIAEQDLPSVVAEEPVYIARRTRAYLRELGIG